MPGTIANDVVEDSAEWFALPGVRLFFNFLCGRSDSPGDNEKMFAKFLSRVGVVTGDRCWGVSSCEDTDTFLEPGIEPTSTDLTPRPFFGMSI